MVILGAKRRRECLADFREEGTMITRILRVGAAVAVLLPLAAGAATLDDVKQRGVLHCGTAPNIPGFAFTDDKGNRVGFDIDLCRAMSAAIFGDANKIKLTPLTPRDAFTTLQSGAVDILTHRFTWTYNRDAGSGLDFVRIIFFGLLDVSDGIEEIGERCAEQVDDGDVGRGLSVAARPRAGGLEQS
ncbi:MAG: transporter substrate-binding domain-containing protein, partial [Alphaproteobacteria bacterium]|nr:transporter substrate-binding domain-containing protein [Alphaproteobacteria bacterium]